MNRNQGYGNRFVVASTARAATINPAIITKSWVDQNIRPGRFSLPSQFARPNAPIYAQPGNIAVGQRLVRPGTGPVVIPFNAPPLPEQIYNKVNPGIPPNQPYIYAAGGGGSGSVAAGGGGSLDSDIQVIESVGPYDPRYRTPDTTPGPYPSEPLPPGYHWVPYINPTTGLAVAWLPTPDEPGAVVPSYTGPTYPLMQPQFVDNSYPGVPGMKPIPSPPGTQQFVDYPPSFQPMVRRSSFVTEKDRRIVEFKSYQRRY